MLLNLVFVRSEHVFTSDRKLLEQQLSLQIQDNKKGVTIKFPNQFIFFR